MSTYQAGLFPETLLRPKWGPIMTNPHAARADLMALTGHRCAGSITACRRRMREVGLLDG